MKANVTALDARPSGELRETLELIRALRGFLQNYRFLFRNTAWAGLVERAAVRVEEALFRCESETEEELE
jgi:hypothetical protein